MSVTNRIEAISLVKSLGGNEILHGIDLTIAKNEILAVMGPSGSGKSTLLHCLAGILQPDSGKVLLDNDRIDQLSDTKRSILRRTTFGFVFQFSQLVPELSTLDNVALPLLLNGCHKKEAYMRAHEWLERVNLGDKAASEPGSLSGGQAQKVAIARAMVIRPSVLFADEPTGSLDSISAEMIMELFCSLAKENQTTIVMVTHEPSIAAYADREIIVRDGKIVRQ